MSLLHASKLVNFSSLRNFRIGIGKEYCRQHIILRIGYFVMRSRMSDSDEKYYETLGLSPDSTMDQVKARYRQLNDAYLKILELSRSKNVPARPAPAGQTKPQAKFPAPQETHTEPIATIKEKFAKGKISETQFEKLVKERYDYLKNKPFIDLSDSELEERLKGFDGLKLDPKYWK
jgi:hypothetical protein